MYVGSIYLVAKQKKVCSQRGANIFYFGFGVRVPTYTYTAYTERGGGSASVIFPNRPSNG